MPRIIAKSFDMPLLAGLERPYLSVSELNELVKETLESQLDDYWVAGEISNLRIPPSGHLYFTLKDAKSQIAAVMFRRQGMALRFTPKNGMAVLCFARVGMYPVRGDLQLYVECMEPRGQGALYLAFEQLKVKLTAEGLFAEARKRPLPFLPACIGIVTSEQGAALYDMLRVIGDRFSGRRIVVRPVKVQGEGAAEEIAAGIKDLCAAGCCDVVIVGRGGGSLEDLWAFNEEIVARAIFSAPVPVISAVGHEIDFTIADFVADRRAPTPTAAAEMVVPRDRELLEQVASVQQALQRAMERKIAGARDDWRDLVRRLSDPGRKLREHQQRLDEVSIRLWRRIQDRLRQSRRELARRASSLDALSPLAVLQRGYSITHKLPEEQIVKDGATLSLGDRLRITFAIGKAVCRVEEKE
jgi:exodeoxyribonuclease VII large subunit